jgi:hypothetical protein
MRSSAAIGMQKRAGDSQELVILEIVDILRTHRGFFLPYCPDKQTFSVSTQVTAKGEHVVVRLWVANTDPDWFDFLASQPGIDEVNFWQPSGSTTFGAIRPASFFCFD